MSSYKEIVKSTGLIGSSQVINILLGVLKSKLFAVFLGPAGVGLFGLYTSIISVVSNFSVMGMGISGVKFLAQSVSTGDEEKIAEVKTSILRIALLTSVIGSLILIIFSKQISQYTFNTPTYSLKLKIIAIATFFTSLTIIQTCFIQGMQRILLLVKASLTTCIICFVVSIPIVYFWRENSIVWVIIINAVLTWLINKYYLHRIRFKKSKISFRNSLKLGTSIIKLGGFLIFADQFALIVLYLVRQFISTRGTPDDLGIFQASWTLSITYVGIILGALFTDYFPRLSKLHESNEKMSLAMNEQTQITLLLGIPCIALMIIFLPIGIRLLYSSKFVVNILLYQCMVISIFTKLITNPIGYILLIKNRGLTYIGFSSIFYLLFIVLVYLLWSNFGMSGIGIGYMLASYTCLILDIYLVHRVFPLKYSKENITLITGGFFFLFTILGANHINNEVFKIVLLSLLSIGLFFFEYMQLNKVIDLKKFIYNKIKRK